MSPTQPQIDRARYIRTVLAWHDVTQAELGRLLGCSQPAAGRKLRGLRRFTDDELLLIAETFDLDPGYMLRPPELEGVLGSVRSAAGTLLTWTYWKVRRSAALSRLPEQISGVFQAAG